jgi:hypothetical protein
MLPTLKEYRQKKEKKSVKNEEISRYKKMNLIFLFKPVQNKI